MYKLIFFSRIVSRTGDSSSADRRRSADHDFKNHWSRKQEIKQKYKISPPCLEHCWRRTCCDFQPTRLPFSVGIAVPEWQRTRPRPCKTFFHEILRNGVLVFHMPVSLSSPLKLPLVHFYSALCEMDVKKVC